MLPSVPADMAIELFSGEKAVDTYQSQSVGIIPWPGEVAGVVESDLTGVFSDSIDPALLRLSAFSFDF